MADNEKSSERQVSTEAGKDKKKKETDGIFLPILVEFTFTFSVIILILLFLTIIGVSLLTGAKLLDIVIRTSVTMLIIGGLLILISSQICSDVLTASIVQEEQSDPQQFEELEVHSPSEVQ